MSELALEISGLKKQFGDFVLHVPELKLERGMVLGLVGQNGAGKSTLINILLNLVYPDAGQVHLLGMQQPNDELAIKQRIGYVSENPVFYEELSVSAMAKVVSSFYPDWDWNLYDNYLKKFMLDPRKRVKQLSKGMKVKLGVTLALSHQPELLILDEPTSGIDPVMRRELLEEIKAVIQDERRTVLFSSHITQDVEQIADYVAILHDGQLVEFHDRESLLSHWRQVSFSLDGLRHGWEQLFVRHKITGNAVHGITNRYDRDWLVRVREFGLLRSLPVRPRQIVAGKYITSVIVVTALMLFVLGYALTIGKLDQALARTGPSLIVASLLLGYSLYLHFRFGTNSAKVVLLISLMALSLLGMSVMQNQAWIATKIDSSVVQTLVAEFDSAAGALTGLAIAIPILWLSFVASAQVFTKQDISRMH